MQVPGLQDSIAEPRYDTAAAVTGTTSLTYFQVPVGQGQTTFGAAATAKSFSDTNMDLAGQLPAGYVFRALGFRLAFAWNIIVADFQVVLNGCFLQLIVGAKPFLTVPARTIPGGNGPFMGGGITPTGTSAVLNNGWPVLTNGFTLTSKPLDLKATENFKVTLTWPNAAPTLTGAAFQPAASVPITIYMDGFLGRPVQ